MILKLMSWGLIFLTAVVQSAVTSAEICYYYGSTDASCSGSGAQVTCVDVCDTGAVDCDHATCRNIGFVAQEAGMTALDECTTLSAGGMSYDAKTTCEDDGVPACAGDDIDLCITACRSTSGVCGGDCLETAVDLADMGIPGAVPCDTLLPLLLSQYSEYSFTEWCECFTFNNTYDMRINCGQSPCSDGDSSDGGSSDGGSSDGGSSNTGMIIGIVVGAVVLVIVIVVVVICMRRRKL